MRKKPIMPGEHTKIALFCQERYDAVGKKLFCREKRGSFKNNRFLKDPQNLATLAQMAYY